MIASAKKYIDLPLPELYDLAARSRRRRSNLAAARPQPLERLRCAARDPPRGGPRRPPAPRETRRRSSGSQPRLRGRGCRAAEAALHRRRRSQALDRPRRELQDVGRSSLRAHARGARALPRARPRRPQLRVSLLYLGHLERDSGNLPAAIAALEKARAHRPRGHHPALLGAYLTQAGRAARRGSPRAAPRARARPRRALTSALAAAPLAARPEAGARSRPARASIPRARGSSSHGNVRLMAGDGPAREAFEQALALNPGAAQAESSLAMLAGEERPRGRGPRALDARARRRSRGGGKLLALA